MERTINANQFAKLHIKQIRDYKQKKPKRKKKIQKPNLKTKFKNPKQKEKFKE